MRERLKLRIRREAFLPTALSLAISPRYIVRNGLYKAILQLALTLQGDILDFGCGSKPYESLFAHARSYVGVDIKSSGHDHRESKVDVFYDGRTLPFPDGHFDAVVCFEVLEHVFNLDEVFTEIRRVLKPQGRLLITIPFAWEEHEIPYDFARYTSYGIRHVFETHLFQVLEVKKTTTYVLAICQLFITYLTQYALAKNPFIARLLKLLLVLPLNLSALLLNCLLPKRYEYFCNSVILGQKSSSPQHPQD